MARKHLSTNGVGRENIQLYPVLRDTRKNIPFLIGAYFSSLHILHVG